MGLRISIPDVQGEISQMNNALSQKDSDILATKNACLSFASENNLQGEAYQNAKQYLETVYLPVLNGSLVAHQEMVSVNNGLIGQFQAYVDNPEGFETDTDVLESAIAELNQQNINYRNEIDNLSWWGHIGEWFADILPFINSLREKIEINSAKIQKLEKVRDGMVHFNSACSGIYDNCLSILADVKTGISSIAAQGWDENAQAFRIGLGESDWAIKLNKIVHALEESIQRELEKLMTNGEYNWQKIEELMVKPAQDLTQAELGALVYVARSLETPEEINRFVLCGYVPCGVDTVKEHSENGRNWLTGYLGGGPVDVLDENGKTISTNSYFELSEVYYTVISAARYQAAYEYTLSDVGGMSRDEYIATMMKLSLMQSAPEKIVSNIFTQGVKTEEFASSRDVWMDIEFEKGSTVPRLKIGPYADDPRMTNSNNPVSWIAVPRNGNLYWAYCEGHTVVRTLGNDRAATQNAVLVEEAKKGNTELLNGFIHDLALGYALGKTVVNPAANLVVGAIISAAENNIPSGKEEYDISATVEELKMELLQIEKSYGLEARYTYQVVPTDATMERIEEKNNQVSYLKNKYITSFNKVTVSGPALKELLDKDANNDFYSLKQLEDGSYVVTDLKPITLTDAMNQPDKLNEYINVISQLQQ